MRARLRRHALIGAELPILLVEGGLAALTSFTLVGPLGLPWWVPLLSLAGVAAAGTVLHELVEAVGLRPIDAGRLDSARLLERLTAFQIDLSQRDGLDFRLTFKLLPAALRG